MGAHGGGIDVGPDQTGCICMHVMLSVNDPRHALNSQSQPSAATVQQHTAHRVVYGFLLPCDDNDPIQVLLKY